ncbi:MAG: fibronectin type III domain-containing protein, partial [Alphaproteobacteria bacterium]|nr:fibronectin type III domain-containing protein [Alphaproteobacteria bacterium]
YLSSNRLTTLPANAFAGLGKLRTLYLSSNRLTTLPANAFAGLDKLTDLDLPNNQLTTLSANAFAGLANVTRLWLTNNHLTTLPANAFAGLANVTGLWLTNNRLTTLPAGAFNGLTPGVVRISGIAGLPSPPAALRFTPRNQALQVQWDAAANTHYQLRWKAAAATTFAADDAAATSSGSHTITGLQNGAEYEVQVAAVPAAPTNTNSATTHLWSSRSGSATLAAPGMPRNLRLEPRIESLRATWNAPTTGVADSYKIRWKAAGTSQYSEAAPAATVYTITGLQNGATYEVQVAAVGGDFTGEFGAAARAAPSATAWQPVCERTAQVRAEIVKRVGGGKTCGTVTAEDLAGISGRLYLDDKSITALKPGDFHGLVNVTRLHLWNNQLTTLPANVFAGLDKLTYLYLSGNQLTTLSVNMFAGLGKLTDLRLDGNELTTLPANAFAGLGKLTSLILWNNHLDTLPANVFAGLDKLFELDLRNNRLTTLPANVFAGLGELTLLFLDYNRLTTLPANVFAGLDKLTGLFLSRNQLTTLPANAFAGLGKLTSLRLHGNQLTALPVGAFNGLTPGLVRISGIAGLPSPPAALRFTPRNQALQVQWDAAANTHYQLRWKAAAATTFAADDAAATSSGSHTITGLQNGAEYEVQVAAVPAAPTNTNSATTHLWSSRSGSATLAAPGMPRNLRLESRFESLRATWNAPASGSADSYKIRWKAVGTSQYAETAPQTTTYTITGLQNATTYEVQVAAVDGDFTGEFGAAARAAPSKWPVCERTAQVRAEIVKRVGGGKTCGTVTAEDLAGIRGEFDLWAKSIAALKSGDFAGLANVTELSLSHNQLTTLPANAFAGLDKLTQLDLSSNHRRLTTLPANAFAGLDKLITL